MPTANTTKLQRITTFPALVDYLRDELDWPIEVDAADELTFEYEPAELGIDPIYAVKIKTIKQIRPMADRQPWGVFFIEFESKRLPVVVLRRILHKFVATSRSSNPNRPVWKLDDLLFISAFGDEVSNQREIAIANFHQEAGDLPTLRVLGWDGADTVLKLDYVAATLKERLGWPGNPSDVDAWRRQWSGAFRHRLGHVIRTADALAERLAILARGIRDAARTLMEHESERGPLRRLHKAFQTALIHDLSEADFADTYAQTITYGLLTAAISRTEMSEGRQGTSLIAENVTDMVPITNPFLREMLQTFLQAGGGQGGIDFDELGIQDVVELLRGDETDLPAILRDFGNRTRGEDPVIHFYEHFLSAYNKQLKVQRGVFYTPQPVVSYIVRSVHELLQTEFGLEDGLASTVTWGEMAQRHTGLKIPVGVAPESPFVQILDPATGTATFLVEVIDVIHRTLTDKGKQQHLAQAQQRAAWNDYVPKHLLPRLHGYELMMAPYAIAHMKIGLKLYETGYRFGSDERARIYLTNALEPASDGKQQLSFANWFPALAHEAQAVGRVKQGQSFTVVIGNPPYSVSSSNKGAWIEGLRETYKKAVRSEHNIQPLSDDYIKFIRLAQDRIERTDQGIVGIITNHAYLSGLIHRGMREELMKTFTNIHVLNLHGNATIGEVSPDGSADENVFDIRQGVAIALFVKEKKQEELAEVKFFELWGKREGKYEYLRGNDVASTDWQTLTPQPPHYFFVPKDFNLIDEYETSYSTTQIFKEYQRGVATRRDHFMVAFDKNELVTKSRIFGGNATDQEIETMFGVKTTQYWSLSQAREIVRQRRNIADDMVEYAYRPFDDRFVTYIPELIERGDAAYGVMQHLLHPNKAILCFRKIRDDISHLFFVVDKLVDKTILSSKDNMTAFPLYFYPTADAAKQKSLLPLGVSSWPGDEANGRRILNLNPVFVAAMEEKLGLVFKPDLPGLGDLADLEFGPEDIFHYAYAVFHSPIYRSRYAEFLKIDFPRLSLTTSLPLFRALCQLGADLVALHLLEDNYAAASWSRQGQSSPLQKPITTFVKRGTGTIVGAVGKSNAYDQGKVYLDTSNCARSSYFEGVPEEVWNFHIGGYQVCHKWLYDRRGSGSEPGRTLSEEDIAHYQRIVVALKETIRLMGEIDAVIEEFGGWPLVGSVSES